MKKFGVILASMETLYTSLLVENEDEKKPDIVEPTTSENFTLVKLTVVIPLVF